MLRRSLTSFLVASSLTLSFVSAQSCYLPNGQDRKEQNPNNSYEICNSTVSGSPHAMCCDSTTAGGGKCQPNGLCYYASFNTIFREGCTDPTWQDPACLKFYINGSDTDGVDRSDNTIMVAPCGGDATHGPFCETNNKTSCCNAKQGFKLEDNGVVEQMVASTTSTSASSTLATRTQTSATASSSSSSPASASASATATPSTAQAAQSQSNSNDGGAIAGGIIGGLLAGVLLACLAFFLLRRRNRQASKGNLGGGNYAVEMGTPVEKGKGAYFGGYPSSHSSSVSEATPQWSGHEMPAQAPRYELAQPIVELPPTAYHR